MTDSIRDALTKAFADAGQEEPEFKEDTPAPEADVSAEVSAQAPTVDDTSTEPDNIEPAARKTAADPSKPTPTAAPAAPVATNEPKAPASWKPEERAAWATIPPAARSAIQRREAETQRVLSTSAEARKFQQQFHDATNKYAPMFEAQGQNLMQGIDWLLRAQAAFEIGTPQQKAQLMAQWIHDFDIPIQELDGYIVNGKKSGASRQATAPRADFRQDPALAPLYALAEQVSARTQAKVEESIEEVSSMPHFEDVRLDVADILESFANKGRKISIEDAYKRALALNDLGPVPTAGTSVSNAASILAKSRKAASSVAGAPKVTPGAKPTTLRDQIAAAMSG